jgi:hypothetical protein
MSGDIKNFGQAVFHHPVNDIMIYYYLPCQAITGKKCIHLLEENLTSDMQIHDMQRGYHMS